MQLISNNIYSLPFPSSIVIFAISDPRVHFGEYCNAIDFIVPRNTPVLSATDGIIDEIKIDSPKGGKNIKFADLKYLNYIVIKHANDEFSIYGHLKYNSAKVKIGQKVKKGQVIALSGISGLLTMPHMHFHVFKKINDENLYTIKAQFDKTFIIHRPNKRRPNEYSEIFNYLEKKKMKVI